MPKTPSGTRIWPTEMPLGRWRRLTISPIGSGIAAICSQPSATVSMIFGVSLRRSTIGAARPAACAASMSRWLAGFSEAPSLRSKRANAVRAALRAAVGDDAMRVLAARAAAPMWAIVAWRSVGLIARIFADGRVAAHARRESPSEPDAGDVGPRLQRVVAAEGRQHRKRHDRQHGNHRGMDPITHHPTSRLTDRMLSAGLRKNSTPSRAATDAARAPV